MLEVLQELATLFATGTGIYVAVGGLDAWRRETTGKRDIELCQTVIERFYEAEHKMNVLRSPFSYSSEGQTRAKEDGEGEGETDRRNSLFIPLERLNAQSNFWSDFFSYKFRMRALFGESAVAAFSEVEGALSSFRAAALVRYEALALSNGADLDRDTRNGLEKTIWARVGMPDAIEKKMKGAISSMEAICVPIVRSSKPLRRKYEWLKEGGSFSRGSACRHYLVSRS